MDLGLFTDSVERASLDEALDLAVRIGATAIEVAAAGASSTPHLDRRALLADPTARERFAVAFRSRGLRIAALNCSGFPLHPVAGDAERRGIEETFQLAGELGVDKVVTMSGCPGDGPGASLWNWVWYPWPPEAVALLERQWDEAITFWDEMAGVAKVHGVRRIAFELHPLHLVYNVPTLLRMRKAVGPIIGANVDPSHLFWQQMDPPEVIRALGPAVQHVHLKDTELVADQVALAGVLDQRPFARPSERAWVFRTIGRGHTRGFWSRFILALTEVSYDDVVSIENEDVDQPAMEGVEEAAAFIGPIIEESAASATPSPGHGDRVVTR
jgi:sugar phosphate isomerase/epimerase